MFQFRESLLELMFKIKDFRTLYNMVIASFIILTFTLVLSNYDEKGEFINHEELYSFFRGGQRVFIYWLLLTAIHFTIIPITKIGIHTQTKYVWLPLYIFHQASLLGLAIWVSENEKLGFATVMMIMSESTRMVMKSHSYFRTKMLYLTDNEYKNYDIKGYTATNNKES